MISISKLKCGTLSKNVIVSRPRSKPKIDPLQPFINGAERVLTLRALEVVLYYRLTMSEHVSRVLNACASSPSTLRLLRTHGLSSRGGLDMLAFWQEIRRFLPSPGT